MSAISLGESQRGKIMPLTRLNFKATIQAGGRFRRVCTGAVESWAQSGRTAAGWTSARMLCAETRFHAA